MFRSIISKNSTKFNHLWKRGISNSVYNFSPVPIPEIIPFSQGKDEILKSDILMDLDKYNQVRKDILTFRRELKNIRRVEIGPYAAVTFENYPLMWVQIQEMLRIEKGGEEQVEDEIGAYNPLIPNKSKLIGTFMFEINNPTKRKAMLYKLGYVEDKMYIKFKDEKIVGSLASCEVDRTTEDGKTSSIHFLKFEFTNEQKEKFLNLNKNNTNDELIFGVDHENYPHMSILSPELIVELQNDLS